MDPKRTLRWIWGGLFVLLLGAEVLIGLFVHDTLLRPYGGDLLVTMLLCCFIRIICPTKGSIVLPFGVFLFAGAVELIQLLHLPQRLGLAPSGLLSVVMGQTFSVADLFCYAAGCLLFFLLQKILLHRFG